MLRLKNVKKTIGEHDLLEDINFMIGSGDKVALIGPNGSGKTTILRLVLGEITPDAGQILAENEKIGYLPQEIQFPPHGDVRSFLLKLVKDPHEFWRVEKILSQLGMNQLDLDQRLNSLSEGQKMKVKLVEVLLEDPTLLLLDEPTNHLDLEGIEWFEAFVQKYSGSVLMISHDRTFLDNTVGAIMEIDEKTLTVFPGNFTDYKSQKIDWVEKRAREFKKQEQKRKQLEQLIENVRKIKAGKKRGRAVQSAKKRLDREVLSVERAAYQEHQVANLTIGGGSHQSKLIVSVEGLSKSYGRKQVFNDLSFELRGNQRAWLFGQNGSGKSTLLEIITNKLEPTAGSVRIGVNLRWGYFQQNQQHLPKEMRVGEYITKDTGLLMPSQYQFLTQFGFPKEYISRKIGTLSPGERARLSFGLFTQNEYDFLILDEPTNHLDVWTKEKIEEALQEYKGALLLVSHDRYFVENVGVDRVLNLNEGKLVFS